MGEDSLSFKNPTLYIDGQPIENVTSLEVKESDSEPKNNIISDFAGEVTFKCLQVKANSKFILRLKIICEISRLSKIFNRTKKYRTKKKLYHRIVKLWNKY